jgi:hypothetical protein
MRITIWGVTVASRGVMIPIGDQQEALLSSNSWQLLSDTVEFPRAFMLRRMNHERPLLDFAAP